MPRRSRSAAARLAVGLAVAALIVSAVGVAVWRFQQLPEGPQEIAWDREACAHCHMHVGDPRFAAQVQLTDGQVFNFDDPGCAATWLSEHGELDHGLHAVWFHAVDADRWLRSADAAFVPAGATPMGFGFGAVARGTPKSLSLEAMQEQLRSRGGAPGERASWR